MKVLMVNGSPHLKGCTYTALEEVGKTLKENGVDYEIFQLGPRPMRDCIGCNKCQGQGCIFKDDNDDAVNRFLEKAKEADGFVFGSPVYYAHPSGQILSFLNRVFYSSAVGELYPVFAGKPGGRHRFGPPRRHNGSYRRFEQILWHRQHANRSFDVLEHGPRHVAR